MIDDIDGKILSILQNDARTSNAEIARRLAMAPSAILERIRKLETRGLIDGYEARLNPKALDMGLLAFIYVRADERIGSRVIGDELAAFPEVQEVHHIAGEDCYLLKVRVADTNALSDLLRQRLGPIDAIRSTRTTIVLSTIKETAQIPLPSTAKEDLSDAG
ncbi:MAG TPA: Lrp/AsnC family transcriptional regulator [Ktedonobacterales bacterium]|jgi:Lrp/AsnC family transcriptional regulator, leucine-responsive regulatory protein|nr:Lrp/AsnC family transcriptional regulator [Ktedonobacterales bacterium]